MKSIVLVFACLCLWSAAAMAEGLPRFDVEAQCEQLASFSGEFSNMTYNSCIQIEQSAYDGLKPAWGALPTGIRNQCVELATFGGPGSYSTLESCVAMETQAANNKPAFSFD